MAPTLAPPAMSVRRNAEPRFSTCDHVAPGCTTSWKRTTASAIMASCWHTDPQREHSPGALLWALPGYSGKNFVPPFGPFWTDLIDEFPVGHEQPLGFALIVGQPFQGLRRQFDSLDHWGRTEFLAQHRLRLWRQNLIDELSAKLWIWSPMHQRLAAQSSKSALLGNGMTGWESRVNIRPDSATVEWPC